MSTAVNKHVIEFLEKHNDLLESEDSLYELIKIAGQTLSNALFDELVTILEGINVDTLPMRENAFEEEFSSYVEFCKLDQQSDRANSWSRFAYIFDGIDHYGFKYQEAYDYVKKNHLQIGLNYIPLERDYSWNGTDKDFDLGWFKPDVYRKMYPEEFED